MSNPRPTSVTILWHMHQPWYGDASGRLMVLPWVRLHALKDYLDMVAEVEACGAARVTFNLVPSLLRQLALYASGEVTDGLLECCRPPAEELTAEQRRHLLDNAFKAHWPTMVEPYSRFRRLLELRGRDLARKGLDEAVRAFADDDLRDLQVWVNLTWCGNELRRLPVVAELLAKGSDFTEADKEQLLATLQEALGGIVPRYAKAAGAGLVELSTTPFYHPILPLLCHFPDALAAMPNCRLPGGAEDLPEDARTHLARARSLHAELFGSPPAGVWPSEGSVSPAALELLAEAGFRWAATDEQILHCSLARRADPSRTAGRWPLARDLLTCHRYAGVDLFFRHRRPSDRIGFDYAKWDAEQAVSDFIRQLERAAAQAGDLPRPVVPVILDGENCWEFYPRNGHDFLARLYTELARHPWLEPVTFSEHLDLAGEPPALDYLFPGSWINHDFYIWAGHREDRRAWELLFAARQALVDSSDGRDPEAVAQAWEHLYIAEGSDWYWWYGDDHSSADDMVFDQLFRTHLRRIYELLGRDAPEELAQPVAGLPAPAPLTWPVAPFTPVIDGRETGFFEWRAAGRVESRGAAGAMSRGQEPLLLTSIRFGFDAQRLYLALVIDAPPAELARYGLTISWQADGRLTRLVLPDLDPARGRHEVALDGGDAMALVAVDRLLELGLPRAALPVAAGDSADLVLTLTRDGEAVERWPRQGAYEFAVPDDRDWLRDWLV